MTAPPTTQARNSWWTWATRRLPLAGPRFWIGTTVALCLAVLGLILAGGHQFVDLQVYRYGWQALANGHDLYGVLPPTSAGDRLPFIYPPFAAIAFAPVSVLPLVLGQIAMFALSVFSLGTTLYVVTRRVWVAGGPRGALALTAAVLPVAIELEPVRSTLSFGQVNLVLMAMVAVDCLAPNNRLPRGLLVGLAAAIKITPAAFVLFFLLHKDFRATRNAVLGAVGAVAVGFLCAPTASAHYWLGQFTHASGLSGSAYATNQTIEAALNRLNVPPLPHTLLWCTLAVAVLAAMVSVMRRCDEPMALIVNAAGALVLSPISWSHHWVWIAPALIVFLGRARSVHPVSWGVATGAATVMFVLAPFQMMPATGNRELHWLWWQHIIGNSYLLVTLLALFASSRHHARRTIPDTDMPPMWLSGR